MNWVGAHVLCLTTSLPHPRQRNVLRSPSHTPRPRLGQEHIRLREGAEEGRRLHTSHGERDSTSTLLSTPPPPPSPPPREQSALAPLFGCLFVGPHPQQGLCSCCCRCLFQKMRPDCARVRSSDSSQGATFHWRIKRLIGARRLIQSAFRFDAKRSKNFLIGEEINAEGFAKVNWENFRLSQHFWCDFGPFMSIHMVLLNSWTGDSSLLYSKYDETFSSTTPG